MKPKASQKTAWKIGGAIESSGKSMTRGQIVAGAHSMHKATAATGESGLYVTKKVRSFKPVPPLHLVYTRWEPTTTFNFVFD
jgi:hypothetical protein